MRRCLPRADGPPWDKRTALRGIFLVLDNGAKWKDLPRQLGAKRSVHKYFTLWTREGVFENIMRDAAELVEDREGFRFYECFVDATFTKARGGGRRRGAHQGGKWRENHGPGRCPRPADGGDHGQRKPARILTHARLVRVHAQHRDTASHHRRQRERQRRVA